MLLFLSFSRVLLLAVISRVSTVPVDVALGKPITADVTCGTDGTEEYFGLDQEFVLPQERVTSRCFNVTQQAARLMVDGDSDTWWQSTARDRLLQRGFGVNGVTPDARIILDLEQVNLHLGKRNFLAFCQRFVPFLSPTQRRI